MTWNGSAMFRSEVFDTVRATSYGNWKPTGGGPTATTRFLLALFDATITPDRRAPRAETCYGAGVWDPAHELSSAPNWPAGGITTGAMALDDILAPVLALGRNGPLTAGPVTLAGVAGDLLYDPQGVLANQGVCFHDFGGSVGVTNGNLSIVWLSPASPWPGGYDILCGFAGENAIP